MNFLVTVSLLIVALVLGIFGVLSIGADQFGPMFTGIACLSISGFILICVLINAIEQIMNHITHDVYQDHDDDYDYDV